MDPLAFILGCSALAGGAAVIAAAGAGIGQGLVAGKAIEAISRQPESAPQVTPLLFLMIGIIETCAIYGLFIFFFLAYANPFLSAYMSLHK